MLIAFNKPFNVLCQFTGGASRRTLADFVTVEDVYPAGRLDYDSEGLVLLTDEGKLQARIADPRHRTKKTCRSQPVKTIAGSTPSVGVEWCVSTTWSSVGWLRYYTAQHDQTRES